MQSRSEGQTMQAVSGRTAFWLGRHAAVQLRLQADPSIGSRVIHEEDLWIQRANQER